MIIIYEKLNSGRYQFIRLNFDTGKFRVSKLQSGYLIWRYIQTFRELGYTFIHR
jgi:hypothetical protein